MLKIDVIKFEAQDVIDSSIPVATDTGCYCGPDCGVNTDFNFPTYYHNGHADKRCTDCKLVK